jgi:ethanolamine utilization protein EutP
MFKKRVIGIITKVDKESSHPDRAEKFLRRAGANEIIRTSAVEKTGFGSLRTAITREELDEI